MFANCGFCVVGGFDLVIIKVLFVCYISSYQGRISGKYRVAISLSVSGPCLPVSMLISAVRSIELRLPSPCF